MACGGLGFLAMEAHEAMERFERAEELSEARERFGRHAAVLVAILAAALAVAALGANEMSKEEILSQAKATDAFNELEANSLKKHVNGNDATILRLLTTGRPEHAAARAKAAALEAATAKKYAPNEVHLLAKAREHEHARDGAQRKHRGFELAEAAFQIAIVLTSVAIIARATALAVVSGLLGLVGLALLIDGFALFVRLP